MYQQLYQALIVCIMKGNVRLFYHVVIDDRIPKLPDHEYLVPIMLPPGSKSLPCHFHTREGLRITNLNMLIDATKEATEERRRDEGNDQCSHHSDKEQQATCESYIEMEAKLHLYAVSAGRVFMFAPSYVGETFKLPHVLLIVTIA